MQLSDIETERAIIGAILQDNSLLKGRQIDDQAFSSREYRQYYKTANSLILGGHTANLLTVWDHIKNQEGFTGSVANLGTCTDLLQTDSFTYLADKLEAMAAGRRLRDSCQQALQALATQSPANRVTILDDFKEISQKLQSEVNGLVVSRAGSYKHISQLMSPVVNQIEAAYKNKGKLSGIASGFELLDSFTNGWQPEDYVVVGARPSVGKTALMVELMVKAAVKDHKRVGIFSAEMSANLVVMRALSNLTGINSNSFRNGNLTPPDFKPIMDQATKMAESGIYIDDTPDIFLNDLVVKSRKMVDEDGCQIIFVDYIGKIRHHDRRMDRWQQVLEVSQTIKSLTRELKVPFVCLSQLVRDSQDRRPTLADLRDSGSLEQDADLIILLHRTERSTEGDTIELLLEKNRNGAIGTVPTKYHGRYSKFIEQTKPTF